LHSHNWTEGPIVVALIRAPPTIGILNYKDMGSIRIFGDWLIMNLPSPPNFSDIATVLGALHDNRLRTEFGVSGWIHMERLE